MDGVLIDSSRQQDESTEGVLNGGQREDEKKLEKLKSGVANRETETKVWAN